MEIPVNITLTISKQVLLEVSENEDGIPNYDKLVEEQICLPINLAEYTWNIFRHDLDLVRVGMPLGLSLAIEDCLDWNLNNITINKI